MAELFLDKAKQFVNDHKDAPFFLYYGLHQPHVPRVPNERFAGQSGMGPAGMLSWKPTGVYPNF